jgi:hypothetical protein
MMKRFISGLSCLATSIIATSAFAQTAPPAPGEGTPMIAPADVSISLESDSLEEDPNAKPAKKEPLPWAGTTLGWDHSATTETLGVGQDVQTLNPTYEWTLMLSPRYKVFSDDDQSISLSAGMGLSREFTNSDITTQRGEWTLTDWSLAAAYSRTLVQEDEYTTGLSVTLPSLSFPTSNFSQDNGKLLGVQGKVGLSQSIPLAGGSATAFKSVSISGLAAYGHAFTEATTATGAELARTRTGLNAEPTISDQISGAPNAKHQVIAGFGASLAILDELSLGTTFQWRPNWKYLPTEADITLDNGVAVTPDRLDDAQNFVVLTMFGADISYQPIKELSVSGGYVNVANQLDPFGQRRNMFYSPNARFYLTVTGHLDAIYEDLTGDGGSSDVASVGSPTFIE